MFSQSRQFPGGSNVSAIARITLSGTPWLGEEEGADRGDNVGGGGDHGGAVGKTGCWGDLGRTGGWGDLGYGVARVASVLVMVS